MKNLLIAAACAAALSACAHKGDDMEMEETMMEEEAMMEEEMMEEEMMEEEMMAEEAVAVEATYCAESGGTVIYDGAFDGEVCRMADGWQMEVGEFYTYGVGSKLEEGALNPPAEAIQSYGG